MDLEIVEDNDLTRLQGVGASWVSTLGSKAIRFLAPSISQGAVRPLERRAAMKVCSASGRTEPHREAARLSAIFRADA